MMQLNHSDLWVIPQPASIGTVGDYDNANAQSTSHISYIERGATRGRRRPPRTELVPPRDGSNVETHR